MSRHVLHWSLATFVLITAQMGAARAQPAPSTAELEEARASFREGLKLSERGRWKAAATKFRQVLLVKPAPAVQYNLAYALSKTNELDDVAWLLDTVVRDNTTPVDVRRKASELEREMKTGAAQLILHRKEFGDDSTVSLDDRRLRLRQDVSRVYVRPGAHRLQLERNNEVVATTRVKVAKEAVHRVAFADLSGAARDPTAGPADSPKRKRLARDWRLWLGVGAALAAGVAVGVAVGRNNHNGSPSGAGGPFQGSFTPGTL